MTNQVLKDEEINIAFLGTNFGDDSIEFRRHRMAKDILDIMAGYSVGHTSTVIMKSLKLLTLKGNVTQKGLLYLHEYYKGK